MILPREVRVGGVEVDISSFDFSDHSSNVPSVKTANAILIVLVSCFVGLRIFVRLFIVRKVFLDDILILAAAVFTITLAAVCIAATNHGLGTHVWLLPPADAFDIAKSCIQYLFVCQVFYACAIAFTKIAIIASYLRFVADGKFRMAMWATSFVIIGLWFTGVFVTIFQCTPVTGAWDFTNTDKKCLNYIKYLYASSSLTVATDIVLCIVPWPYLWRLHMPLKQRIILCLLFGGGAGACVASIVRISKLHTLQSMDITYQCVPCLNLSVIECSLGIICVSIPPLRPLAAQLFPQSLRSKGSSSGKSPLGSLSFSKRSGPSNRDSRNQLDHGRNANTYGEESSEELTSLGQTTTVAACSPTDEEKMNEESRPSREDDS